VSPLNLLASQAQVTRRMRVICVLLASALSGGSVAAWALLAQAAERAQQQADVAVVQIRLEGLQKQVMQAQTQLVQDQKQQNRFRYVQALQQRAQSLNGLTTALAVRWPSGLQINEWRLEGALWRVQGMAHSSTAVASMLKDLASDALWLQPPALLELATAPAALGSPLNLRYLAQARLAWPELQPVVR
jgi:Tfp pilus assembly protein PilN